jgi:rhombotail lipoprotein
VTKINNIGGFMMKKRFLLLSVFAVFSFTNLAGCMHNQMSKSSSSVPLSSFMAPVSESRQVAEKTPLRLPASVAILFVPGKEVYGAVPYTSLYQASEKLKQQLLNNPKYISSVTVVQADETKNKISLAEIRASYTADIVIILSYQQDQRNSQSGAAGLMDMSVVGAFLVPGVETKTVTLIDAKVIHIPNQALIFRTSAIDERSKKATSYDVDINAREESINGLLAATAEVGNSLNKSLIRFENYDMSQAVQMSFLSSGDTADGTQANDYWKKVDTYKSSGGGAFGFIPLLIALSVCGLAWRRK